VVTVLASNSEAIEPEQNSEQPVVPAIFSVARSGKTNDPLQVAYQLSGTANNGIDYLELPGTVDIPAGATSAPIRVNPIEDGLVEGIETVVITISPVAYDGPERQYYVVGSPSHAAAFIRDHKCDFANSHRGTGDRHLVQRAG
jgi:hypothetical protein